MGDLVGNRVHESSGVPNVGPISLNLMQRSLRSQCVNLLLTIRDRCDYATSQLKLLLEQETLLVHLGKVSVKTTNIE